MSVNILVDVFLEEQEGYFAEKNPLIRSGQIAINHSSSNNVLGEIKIGNGNDYWRDLPYVTNISAETVNKWRIFAQNSGTNSRLITLPDMNIAYANYDADLSDVKQIVSDLGTFIEFSDGEYNTLNIESSNIDISKVINLLEDNNKEISSLNLI